MLHVDRASLATTNTRFQPEERSYLALEDLRTAVKRRWPLILLVTGLFVAMGAAVIVTSKPTYVATAKLLIDSHGQGSMIDGATPMPVDSADVDSQVEVLDSASVASAVIHDLNLMSDPDFVPTNAADGTEPFRQALSAFGRALSVRRVGQSYAIEVSFQAHSPTKSAAVANQVVEYYLTGRWREDARPEGSRRFNDSVQKLTDPVSNAQIITRAQVPLEKSSPRSSLIIALALSVGLLVGCTLALLIGRQDTRICSYDQVTRAIDTDAFETVPRLRRREAHPSRACAVTLSSPLSPFTNALRSLQTAVNQAHLAQGPACIGVVATKSRNGSTTLVANLAALYAASGAKVLLIDANFRNPSLSSLLAAEATRGLVELLHEGPVNSIHRSEPHGVWIIPIVRRQPSLNSAHLLRSPKIAAFLAEAKTRFDLVLIDLPGFGSSFDGRLLSAICDGTLVVCEWKATRTEGLIKTVAAIDKLTLPLGLTVILNKVPDNQLT